MKRIACLIGVVVAIGFHSWATSGQAAPTDGVGKFMRPKLAHAQKVLEGLALEDFDAITKSANAMFKLSEAADWKVLPDPEYVSYSSEFQKLTNQLAANAAKKNLDAATLSYVQLTMNCVNCHKHVRDVRRVASVN